MTDSNLIVEAARELYEAVMEHGEDSEEAREAWKRAEPQIRAAAIAEVERDGLERRLDEIAAEAGPTLDELINAGIAKAKQPQSGVSAGRELTGIEAEGVNGLVAEAFEDHCGSATDAEWASAVSAFAETLARNAALTWALAAEKLESILIQGPYVPAEDSPVAKANREVVETLAPFVRHHQRQWSERVGL